MAEQGSIWLARRLALMLSAVVLAGAPASGQGAFPPVPGPFPVMPGAGMAPAMPAAPARPDRPETAQRPLFQAPASAMRVPYWMQAPGAGTAERTETAPAAARPAGPEVAPAQAATVQTQVATGYVQPMAPWGAPGYGAQGYVAPGYGVGVPWQGQMVPGAVQAPAAGTQPVYVQPQAPAAPAPAGGWGVPQQQPAWGYGVPPGWGPMVPFGAAPVWGGWAPATGAGQ